MKQPKAVTIRKRVMPKTDSQRFFEKVCVDEKTGCWNWTGAKDNGYGIWWLNGKNVRAHRASLFLHGIEVVDGLCCDHLCRNHSCVNPKHIEQVTIKENVMRGVGISASNWKKTHCVNGHELSGNNVHLQRGKHRVCLSCRKDVCDIRKKQRIEKRKAKR